MACSYENTACTNFQRREYNSFNLFVFSYKYFQFLPMNYYLTETELLQCSEH